MYITKKLSNESNKSTEVSLLKCCRCIKKKSEIYGYDLFNCFICVEEYYN